MRRVLDYRLEREEAKRTLTLSGRVASSFVAQLGALAPIIVPPIPLAAHIGRRPGFQATILDDKYWFAKLYELITYYEVRDCEKFDNPGFVLHFIPIFYDLYHGALQNYRNGGKVSPLWRTHMEGLRQKGEEVQPGTLEGAKFSIRSGVAAHVQGDMSTALENAYRTWRADPKPPFESLKNDFFATNRQIFNAAKAAFFLDLNDKGPFPFRADVGQYIIAQGEPVAGGGLSVDEVYLWRGAAWNQAASRLRIKAAVGQ
jgi:hypothetical protein